MVTGDLREAAFSVTPSAVCEAHARIRSLVHRTPILTSQSLNDATGAELFFKAENLQKTGAFKARGATNAILTLVEQGFQGDVATHSSGNHGAALAWAAHRSGIGAHVVMPKDSVPNKIAAVQSYGARVHLCEASLQSRDDLCAHVMERTGSTFIHPYDDDWIIAGQGTAALELLEQVPDLETIIAPVGGGGLLSGTLITANEMAPGIDVYGAEPERSGDAFSSMNTGTLQGVTGINTIADGLRAGLSERTFQIIRGFAAGVLQVSEEAILSCTVDLLRYLKTVVEPSAAVALAGLMEHADSFRGKRVGVILTGGNLDLENPPWL